MFDLIQKFIYSILAIQEKFFLKKSKKDIKSVYANTTSKKVYGQAASLELTCKSEKSKAKVDTDIKIILKKYENDPEKLMEFVQKKGTKVFRIKSANKILKLIKYEEGFVASTSGIKALYLNLMIPLFSKEKAKFSFKTEGMFVLPQGKLDNYLTIQQFHKWYSMKLNLPGFDSDSQENFQKFLNSNDADIKELSIEEILGLKEAIARDVEAINFIVDMAKSTTGSKNALKKMTTGGASV